MFDRKCPNCNSVIPFWPFVRKMIFDSSGIRCNSCEMTISEPLSNYAWMGLTPAVSLYLLIFHTALPNPMKVGGGIVIVVITVVVLYLFVPLSTQPEQDSNESNDNGASPPR